MSYWDTNESREEIALKTLEYQVTRGEILVLAWASKLKC